VRPVPDDLVDAVRPHVARQVWAMIELQRLTAMRPGEVVIMRGCDINRGSDVWAYEPAKHKTEYHGKGRRVLIGPRAQEVLMPWLRPDPSEYLFSPREAMGEFRREQRLRRKTPLYPSLRDRKRNPNMNLRLRNHYTTQTYNRAIGYGCRRADIPLWHANQLRHSAATRIRCHTDLDAARSVLGHSDLKTSEIYAERDWELAEKVMRLIG
jgi:integrase